MQAVYGFCICNHTIFWVSSWISVIVKLPHCAELVKSLVVESGKGEHIQGDIFLWQNLLSQLHIIFISIIPYAIFSLSRCFYLPQLLTPALSSHCLQTPPLPPTLYPFTYYFVTTKTPNTSNQKWILVQLDQYSPRKKYQRIYVTRIPTLYNSGEINCGNYSYVRKQIRFTSILCSPRH